MPAAKTVGRTRLDTPPIVRPFLKWAGNKFRIVDRVRGLLPSGKRLVEPFVGSGAVFLNTDYPNYLLCDVNADLINLYRVLQSDGPAFIERCRRLFTARNNTPENYYALRERFNANHDIERRAAQFLYLNRHGYNGLCRYNSKGGFNVPFGRYRRPYFPEAEMLAFHAKAQRALFEQHDFRLILPATRRGDVVYADPPYDPLTPSANFTAYSAGGFGRLEQEELAQAATEAAGRGVPVLISNHDTAFTRRAYGAAHITPFQVQRYISCNGRNRQKASELLALFPA